MSVNLCQLGPYSCFGCCGHSWTKEQDVLVQIGKNTKAFASMSREKFSKRGEEYLASCGSCKSLVNRNGRIVCGLHPMQNDGTEYRDKICEKNYLCDTFKAFLKWDANKQEAFQKFVLGKNLSNWDYSMGMDKGTLMKEFNQHISQPKP